ncbi:MAG TPA: hypothetical protein VNR11_01865 [Xanthobacteraceae bacterium]|nr:hypothetical protein [Xanthobacteraceae bacterium]
MELATIEGSIMNCRTPTHDCLPFERDCRRLYKAIDLCCLPHFIDLDQDTMVFAQVGKTLARSLLRNVKIAAERIGFPAIGLNLFQNNLSPSLLGHRERQCGACLHD